MHVRELAKCRATDKWPCSEPRWLASTAGTFSASNRKLLVVLKKLITLVAQPKAPDTVLRVVHERTRIAGLFAPITLTLILDRRHYFTFRRGSSDEMQAESL